MICFPIAKVNLGLNITRRRPDGYHDLETVFYPVWGLQDALEVIPKEDGNTLLTEYGPMATSCPMGKNLVHKAYMMLKERFGLPEVDIHLLKAIPSQAGLGGGSADASFMLKGLDELFRLGLPKEELRSMALHLGADCPIFIDPRPSYAEGVGEKLEPIDLDLSGYDLIIVKPDLAISTKEAFQGITPKIPKSNAKDIVLNVPIDKWQDSLHNDFEDSLFPKYPVLSDIKTRLLRNGALYASMSGSGSSLYGIFSKDRTVNFEDFPKECFIGRYALSCQIMS